jgi:hypothetical protein
MPLSPLALTLRTCLTILLCIGVLGGSIYLATYYPHAGLYGLMGAIALFVECFRKKDTAFDYLTIINVLFIWMYSIIPILMITYPHENEWFVEFTPDDYLVPFFIVLISYLFIVLGYTIAKGNALEIEVKQMTNTQLKQVMMPLFIVGFLSMMAYGSIYGGIVNVLQNADRIRSGFGRSSSPLVFFRQPAAFLFPVCWMAFGMMLKPDKYKSKWVRGLYFAFFLLMAIVQALTTAGRSQLIFLIMPLIIGYYKWKGTRPKLWIVALIGGLGVTFVLFGNNIFSGMRGEKSAKSVASGEGANPLWSLTREFLHPIGSLIELVKQMPGSMDPGWFSDAITAVLQLVPERLLGISVPEGVSSFNTMMLTGVFKATIPPGLVGFFFYSCMWAGIPLGALAFGYFHGRLDSFMHSASKVHPMFSVFYAGLVITVVGFMMGGDPRVYINLYLWGLWLPLLFSVRKADKRVQGAHLKKVQPGSFWRKV